jgi:hypothetical protein
MRRFNPRFARIGATLLVTVSVLCPRSAAAMVEHLAQPHAIECNAPSPALDAPRRPSRQIGGYDVAFPCFLHSLTSLALPIERASQHVSSGFAVDEDWLRLIPTSVTQMALNLFDTVRSSTIAIAVGALVSACGGGGGGATSADETTQASSTSSDSGAAYNGGTASNSGATSTAGGASAGDTVATNPSSGSDMSTTQASDAASADSANVLASMVASAKQSNASTNQVVAPHAASARSPLGINLGSLDYYSPAMPTIDLMKKANPWFTQCNPYSVGSTCKNLTGGASSYDTLEESKMDLDSDGWVRSLPASDDATLKFRSVATIILSGGWQQAGQYIVRYDGAGTLAYSGSGARNAAKSTAGRDVVDVVNTSAAALTLSITATTPGNYVRNIRVYPPGGACANDMTTYAASAAACTDTTGAFVAFENFPSTAIWHPALLSELKGFRTARFMDWQRTNTSTVTDWSQRTVATARSWNTASGAPIEQIVNLANAANIDPWVNVPTRASDDYVRHFAQVVHQQLASNLSVNVEFSNEPWNYAFPATHWIYDQAQAAWPAEVAAKTNTYLLATNWYANRLVQVCSLIKAEFGTDKGRVRCIANTQAAGSPNDVLNCTVAAKTLGQPCAKSIDVVAVAPYFAGYVGSTKLRPTVASWYTQADGGLNQLFNEIMGAESSVTSVVAPLVAAGSSVPGGSLAQIHGWMTSNKAALDRFSIPMWAYEGGQGLTPPGGDTDASLVNLFIAANRDARMGAAYTRMLSDWQSAGGQTFVLYDDVSSFSKYGMWGLKENQIDTSSAKWTAVAKVRDTVVCWWSGC